jgi:dienelactone hydrolase
MKCVLALAFVSLMISAVAAAQEKVSFPTTDADLKGGTPTTITGYLYKPAGSGPFAALVSIPGCDGVLGETDNFLGKKGEIHPLYGQWGEILSRAGYLVFLIDSFRPRGHSHQCGLGDIVPNKEILRDAFGAMNYLRSRKDIKQYNIAMMGQSYGGSAVMSTIANNIILKLQKNDFRAAVAFYPGCVRIDDAHWHPRMPMLLLMGELDNGGSVTRCMGCRPREGRELVTLEQINMGSNLIQQA